MDKKIIFGLGLCIILLISFAGCTGPEKNLDPHIKKIKDAGKLVVGTNAEFAPWEYVDENGTIVGLDIDIAQEIADYLGVELKVENMVFNMTIFANALNDSKVDIIIAALSIKQERPFLFSNAYFSEGQVIIVNGSTTNINAPEDLANKTVGVQNGTTSEDAAQEHNPDKIITYENYELALDALLKGDIDAIVIDNRAGEDLIKKASDVKIVRDPFTVEYYGIAMKKGDTAVKEEIDEVIGNLKASGKMKEIEDKWFK